MFKKKAQNLLIPIDFKVIFTEWALSCNFKISIAYILITQLFKSSAIYSLVLHKMLFYV